MYRINLKVFFIFLSIVFPLVVTANDLSDEERKIRKYVSRTYQATDGALARCSSDYTITFKTTLNKFKKTYPELMSLVRNSKYYPQAVSNYADDIERTKSKPQEKLTGECQFMSKVLDEMIDTEKGKASVLKAIKIIQN